MFMNSLQSRLIHLSPGLKRFIIALCDSIVLVAVLWAAVILLPPAGDSYGLRMADAWLLLTIMIIGAPLLASQGLYRAIIRFFGEEMIFAVLRGVSLLAMALTAANMLWGGTLGQALALGMVFWAFAILALCASRLAMRALLAGRRSDGERIAIYGAGQAGLRLTTAIANGRDCCPVLFIDDDPMLQGRVVAGLPVCGPEDIAGLVDRFEIRRVLLALPSASRRKRQEIIARLENVAVRVQTVPDIADLIAGRARVNDVRDVDVADLLGREIVPPNDTLLGACIAGKTVMVTGAGGSIGSELCRQIVRLNPARLVLYERSAAALFENDIELRRILAEGGKDIELVQVLGTVLNPERMRRVMVSFGVQTIYHAAAYKHVPLVEYNMTEGVYNNAIGTWHTAEAACAARVETFVLISTDKAVMPANVMGASKRFAELLLQAMSQRQSGTRFCMVRFGNVLDSSGSVVPVFREQIRRGGPVTVTHRDIIRYFMTIPEAAQLVLQAGAMCKGGDVFVLDMGEPVRIADLARRMIRLMGFSVRDDDHPDGDIGIEFTGLRPAEKLYEELLIGTNVMGTEHPMIMRAMEDFLPWEVISGFAQQLEVAAARADCDRVRALLMEAVGGYKPANGVDDLLWQVSRIADLPATELQHPKPRPIPAPALATVTDLAARRAGGPSESGATGPAAS